MITGFNLFLTVYTQTRYGDPCHQQQQQFFCSPPDRGRGRNLRKSLVSHLNYRIRHGIANKHDNFQPEFIILPHQPTGGCLSFLFSTFIGGRRISFIAAKHFGDSIKKNGTLALIYHNDVCDKSKGHNQTDFTTRQDTPLKGVGGGGGERKIKEMLSHHLLQRFFYTLSGELVNKWSKWGDTFPYSPPWRSSLWSRVSRVTKIHNSGS